MISGAGDMTAIPTYIPTDRRTATACPAPWFLPQVADVLGRGRHDLVFPNPDNDGTFVVYLNGDPQDQLVSITDGMSALDPGDPGFVPTVSIRYESLIDRSITNGLTDDATIEEQRYLKHADPSNDCAYPRTCVVGPSRVVAAYAINDGQNQPRSFSVKYRDGRYHRLGRGMLGFGERIVVDDDTGAGRAELYDNKTWDDTLQVFPFAGQTVASWSWAPASAVPTQSSGTGGKPTQVELVYGNDHAPGGADRAEDVLHAPGGHRAEARGGDVPEREGGHALRLRVRQGVQARRGARRHLHGRLELRPGVR